MATVAAAAVSAHAHVVWQIGQKDGTGNEFALAPDRYSDFLQHDFGWENNYFLVGRSEAKKSFPYVLPSINDKWAGSGSPAGRRTQQVNILFDIAKKGTDGAWTLVIDFADVHKAERPLLKVSVNGKARKMVLPVGGGDESIMKGDFSKAKPFAAKFDLADGEIVEGANEIKITSIEGSWAIFDDVRLEGPKDAVVRLAHKGAYVRNVKAGDYLIPGTGKQPLLVDVEHLEGAPVVRVEIDGKVALEQRVEAGAYSLEAPMDTADLKSNRVEHVERVGSLHALHVLHGKKNTGCLLMENVCGKERSSARRNVTRAWRGTSIRAWARRTRVGCSRRVRGRRSAW